MSLQVWLPLNGTLENKGLDDIEFASTTASGYEDGKIGKALQMKNSYVDFTVPSLIDAKIFSVAFWYKAISDSSITTAWNKVIRFPTKNADGTTGSYFRFESSYGDNFTNRYALSVHNNTSQSLGSVGHQIVALKGEWHHACLTHTPEQNLTYRDGVLITTGVGAAGTINGRVMIAANAAYPNGLMNDFRIYDHCLSEKEVKELSKGLVAHYPLNDLVIETNPNLVLNPDGSEFNGVYVSGTHYWTDVGEANDRSIEQINGKSWFHCVSPTNSGYGGFYQDMTLNPTISIESDTDYTLSLDIFASTDCEFYVAVPLARPRDFTHRFNVTTSPNRYSCTFNSETIYDPSVYSFILGFYSIPQGIELYFTNVKFEKSSSPTPYEAIGYVEVGDTTIYDTSGYGHNGTVSANPPIGSIDSPRYSSCAEFNGTDNTIDLGVDTWLPTDAITVSLWAYNDDWSTVGTNCKTISCTQSGGWNFEQGSGGGYRFAVFKEGLSYAYATPVKKWTDYAPGWHHIVGTFDGYVSRIYIDGVLDSTSTSQSPDQKTPIHYNGNTHLFIGCEANTANPSAPYFNGKISDVRIYCTALSTEDIKELYEVSASIDNKGNVYAYELVES